MILVVETGQQAFNNDLNNHQRAKAVESLSLVRAELVAELSSEIYRAASLATFVTYNPDFDDQEWQTFANMLLADTRHTKLISLAPDNILQHVYPLQGNEAVVGMDYRSLPGQYDLVEQARQTRGLKVAGPLNLVQGGQGLIVRIPIFSPPETPDNYWGAGSTVIDLDSVIAQSSISRISGEYDIAIRGSDGLGKTGEVFFGSAQVFDAPVASESIHLPNGEWYMAATLNEQQGSSIDMWQANWVRLLGIILLLLTILSLCVFYVLYRRAHAISMRDELTRLPNRRRFMQALEQAILHTGTRHGSFAVLYIDLDGFKQINDSLGHAAGDAMLVEVGKRLFDGVRTTDLVARAGGDEFLVLLTRVTEKEDVDLIAEGIEQKLCEGPFRYQQQSIPIRASVGYAMFPQDAETIDELLILADRSMYKQKQRHKSAANV